MAKKTEETVAAGDVGQMPAEVAGSGGLPAALAERFQADAGQGSSTAQDDTIIPLLGVVQKGSPHFDETHPKYAEHHIEGIKPGDIVLDSHKKFWPRDTGLLFLPCHFDRWWNRWRPRDEGGGFMGRYSELPSDAQEYTDPERPARTAYRMPDGSELIETRNHYGIIVNGNEARPTPAGEMQALLSVSSTGHTFSRQWMTQMNSVKLPNGAIAPTRSRLWLLRTVPKSNAAGSWFGLSAEDRGWVPTEELYAAGTALYEAIQEGKVRAAEPPTGGDNGGDQDREIPF